MKNNDKPRYRILWYSERHDLITILNVSLFATKHTHILAPVFNGGLQCTLPWYYFNNETL